MFSSTKNDYLLEVLPQKAIGGANGLLNCSASEEFSLRQQVTVTQGVSSTDYLVARIVDSTTLQLVNTLGGTYPNLSAVISGTILARFQLNPLRHGFGAVKLLTKSGGSPEMNVDGSVTPQTFSVTPDVGTRYTVTGLGISMVASMPINTNQIPDNQIPGIGALTNGILSTTQINNVFTFSGLFKTHAELLSYPTASFHGPYFYNVVGPGAHTRVHLKYDVSFDVDGGSPLILDSRTSDQLSFIIQDNLSPLLFFRILTNGITETVFPSTQFEV